MTKYNAAEKLKASLTKHGDVLNILIAENALWVHPSIHQQLAQSGNPAKYPNVRRARPDEKKGQRVNGVRFDDNTYANNAIKSAFGGRKNFTGYAACHIWETTCYDERYHTVLANLVLLPRALESLTDHHQPVKEMLRYHSYQLYKWLPEGLNAPNKPDGYDRLTWIEPEETSMVRSRRNSSECTTNKSVESNLTNKLEKWSRDVNLNIHKIISLIYENKGISRDDLIKLISYHGFSRNPSGAVSSMLSDKGNSYGEILKITEEGNVEFLPEVESIVGKLEWTNYKK